MAEYRRNDIKQSEWFIAARSVFIGAAAGLCVCALLLCAASALIVKAGMLPTDLLPIITIVIGAAGAFSGGYLSVAMFRKRGLLTGLLTGGLMFLSVFITALISSSSDDVTGTLIKCGVFVLAGSIGGVVRVNKRRKVRRVRG